MANPQPPVDAHNITSPAFSRDPVSGYNQLRQASPASWQHSARGYLLTDFANASGALCNPDLKEPSFVAGWEKIGSAIGKDFQAAIRLLQLMPFVHEGERHRELRNALAKGIAPFAGAESVFASRVQRSLKVARSDGGLDPVKAFSGDLLFDILCDCMGMPQEVRDNVRPLAHLSAMIEPTQPVRAREAATRIVSQSVASLHHFVDKALRQPGDTLVHSMARALPPTEPDTAWTVAHLMGVILVMGNDALSGCIAFPVRHLLLAEEKGGGTQRQHGWARISDDAIRFAAPVDLLNRIASADTNIGSQRICEGERVIISPLAANHDPNAFGCDASHVRYRGKQGGTGLAFGAGAHVCVGLRMSRMIVHAAFSGLSQLPPLRLQSCGLLGHGRIIRTLESLPVELI